MRAAHDWKKGEEKKGTRSGREKKLWGGTRVKTCDSDREQQDALSIQGRDREEEKGEGTERKMTGRGTSVKERK